MFSEFEIYLENAMCRRMLNRLPLYYIDEDVIQETSGARAAHTLMINLHCCLQNWAIRDGLPSKNNSAILRHNQAFYSEAYEVTKPLDLLEGKQ